MDSMTQRIWRGFMENGMLDGMLDELFGKIGVGADIDIDDETPEESVKTEPPKEEKKEEEKMEDPKDGNMGNLPKSMDPHKMYGSKFDDWVKENRPDAYKE